MPTLLEIVLLEKEELQYSQLAPFISSINKLAVSTPAS